MKRRTFLRGLAGAVAVAMAPVLLNTTRLALVNGEYGRYESVRFISTVILHKVDADGERELLGSGMNVVTQESIPMTKGVDSVVEGAWYQPSVQVGTGSKHFRFSGPDRVSEIGVAHGDGRGYVRHEFDKTITLTEDEELDVTYEWRRA